MNYLSDPTDELIMQLREWCKNNPLDRSEYNQEIVPSWNKGISHTNETKKLISQRQMGNSYSRGKKKPHAKENLKHIKHRAFGQYKIVSPDGTSSIIVNLKKFCLEKDLNYTSMSSLASGKWPCDTYKGFQCFKLGYIKIRQ